MLTHKLCNSKFIFSSRLLDTFALFFLRIWSLNFLWSNTPSFSSHCWSPLPLLTFSSLLLPATTKMTIRPLKKKTLLHISTYHCKTQIWALKFDCLRLLLEGLQFLACYFLDSTLSIYALSKKKKKKPSIKIISFEFCLCLYSSICNIPTKRGQSFPASHPLGSKTMTGLQIYAQFFQLLFSKRNFFWQKWW